MCGVCVRVNVHCMCRGQNKLSKQTEIIIITRSGARFARPLLVYEFRDCCFDWLEGRDRL